MSTMNISLPGALEDFVDEQVQSGAYGSRSEYVRELIRKEQQRLHLRSLLVAGGESPAGPPATPEYFEALRKRVKRGAKSSGAR